MLVERSTLMCRSGTVVVGSVWRCCRLASLSPRCQLSVGAVCNHRYQSLWGACAGNAFTPTLAAVAPAQHFAFYEEAVAWDAELQDFGGNGADGMRGHTCERAGGSVEGVVFCRASFLAASTINHCFLLLRQETSRGVSSLLPGTKNSTQSPRVFCHVVDL